MTVFLNAIKSILVKLLTSLLSKFSREYLEAAKENKKLEDTQGKEKSQAEIVRELSRQVTEYLRKGEPVPKELEDKLREENRKLVLSRMAP